ncbi:MAG: 23S rRNA (uracil(1939)-C(5))-methyltransferase RlmD [Proteobacteria bacterium]|nr:23S rRNA (uracil(1939)-C(5))-methyltransferase RlmD [Pseudomonadota bacterium]
MRIAQLTAEPVLIESLDHAGQGVAHRNGKTLFIEGALPGETVYYELYRNKSSFETGRATHIVKASTLRVDPRCPAFERCGGCSLQHLGESAQVVMKQRVLEDNLWHIGRVRPEVILPAVQGLSWHYRHRARLSVRNVATKGILIGFHEKRSSFIVDTLSCDVLAQPIASLLGPLRDMVQKLSIVSHLPQIEVAVGEITVALVFRILKPLVKEDEGILRAFSERYNLEIWLQSKGPASAYRFYPEAGAELYYSLPEFNLRLPFYPTEFTQINPEMNRVLIHQAMQLLEPRPEETILDLFCGLGNFTLPLARMARQVVGIEADDALIGRALSNAQLNSLDQKVALYAENLFEMTFERLAALGHFDQILLDPPRDGAIAVVKSIDPENGPKRIVYVSCNPATLARDANVLVHAKGYRPKAAGVLNMFPHTSHIESIMLFERN